MAGVEPLVGVGGELVAIVFGAAVRFDPADQRVAFGVVELRAPLGGHLVEIDALHDVLPDVGSGEGFGRVAEGGEVEAAVGFGTAVAGEAMVLDDGADFRRELVGRLGRGFLRERWHGDKRHRGKREEGRGVEAGGWHDLFRIARPGEGENDE